MRATNLRLGFATNSSSTHSVVFGAGSYKSSEATHVEEDEYGWDHFVLDSSNERVSYLYAAVAGTLSGLPDYQRDASLRELFSGYNPPPASLYGPHIDHQSAFTLPNPQSGLFPHVVREALEFFCDSRVTIHGGNDNGGKRYGKWHLNNTPDGASHDYLPIRIRRDGNNYVIFNWRTGGKLRVAPAGASFGKASRPELVDLKITDACPFGCAFCYQSSTQDGAEADWRLLSTVIEALGVKHLGVFEAAIGGGEPTSSDRFVDVIDKCCENFIVPNFTTFAVDWLLDDRKVEAASRCGGIGVSVHNERQVSKAIKIKETLPRQQVMAQHVFGTLPAERTLKLITACKHNGIPLLLLGYKNTGMGASHEQVDQSAITKQEWNRSSFKGLRLSVDTAFVNQHQHLLDWLAVDDITVTRQEGAFSCYIDAVTGKVGPSSYCDQGEMTGLSTISRDWDQMPGLIAGEVLAAFSSYPAEPAEANV